MQNGHIHVPAEHPSCPSRQLGRAWLASRDTQFLHEHTTIMRRCLTRNKTNPKDNHPNVIHRSTGPFMSHTCMSSMLLNQSNVKNYQSGATLAIKQVATAIENKALWAPMPTVLETAATTMAHTCSWVPLDAPTHSSRLPAPSWCCTCAQAIPLDCACLTLERRQVQTMHRNMPYSMQATSLHRCDKKTRRQRGRERRRVTNPMVGESEYARDCPVGNPGPIDRLVRHTRAGHVARWGRDRDTERQIGNRYEAYCPSAQSTRGGLTASRSRAQAFTLGPRRPPAGTRLPPAWEREISGPKGPFQPNCYHLLQTAPFICNSFSCLNY